MAGNWSSAGGPRGTAAASPATRQSGRFLALYALASAGGSASYAPFLTLLLPARAAEMAGAGAVQMLSYAAFLGAVAASLSNIAFGWASDRTRNRRGWIVAGLALSCALLVSMQFIDTLPRLLAAICVWQIALNMMLAPLAAWAGDTVPDNQKGLLGGLMSLAPGTGAMVGAIVTLPGLATADQRLVLVAVIVSAMVLPAVIWGKPNRRPQLTGAPIRPAAPSSLPGPAPRPADRPAATVRRMWLARLLMQISEAALFAFLFLWLRDLDPRISDHHTATIFTLVTLGAAPLALTAGRWSDRQERPMTPLLVATLCGAAGLAVMAASVTATTAIAGYMVFGVSAGVFLALHTSQTLRVLPRPEHRGRDLGFFNLTNTFPSLIMPAFSLTLVPAFGFRGLFVLLAILACLSGLLLPRREGR